MINIAIICKEKEEQKLFFGLLSGQNDFQIVYTGRDGYDALSMAAPLKPNVVIMDLRLPDIEGPDLAPILKRKSPSTALMVFSSSDEKELVGKSMKAGISAYLLKEADMNILTDLIRIVSFGGCYISAPIITRIFNTVNLDSISGSDKEAAAFQAGHDRITQKFTSTERCIIILLAQGFSDREIARELNLAQGTVRNCLSKIRQKTGMKSRTQIVIYALMYGLINFNQLDIFKVY